MKSWKTSKSKQQEPSTKWKFCFDEFPLWGFTSPPRLSCLLLFFCFDHFFLRWQLDITSWWLNQPIWKICASQNEWKSSPIFRGENSKDIWNHHLDINRFRNAQVSMNVTKLPGTEVGFWTTTVSTIFLNDLLAQIKCLISETLKNESVKKSLLYFSALPCCPFCAICDQPLSPCN